MNLFTVEAIRLPGHLKGRELNGNEYIKGERREWTKGEIEWCKQKKKEGYTYKQIAEATDRTLISVKTKIQKTSKKEDTYNEAHREEKYQTNDRFSKKINPKTILDVYAGEGYWKKLFTETTSNDKDTKYEHEYNLDALQLMCKMYQEGEKFDIVDLDPYGSAYDCLPIAAKIAKKGLIVSFGEWGHKRWKRYDFVEPRYGITNQEDFTDEKFIAEVKRIARMEKKEAIVVEKIRYNNFLRVYFKLEPYKQTSQWEKQ